MISAKILNHVFDIDFNDSDFQNGKINNKAFTLEIEEIHPNTYKIKRGKDTYTFILLPNKENDYVLEVVYKGMTYTIDIEDADRKLLKSLGIQTGAKKGSLKVKAPMPGKVLEVSVKENQEVKKADTLFILEAMKMENAITAELEGVVKTVHVSKGEIVDKNQVLLEFQSN